jgi:hypothetical protein
MPKARRSEAEIAALVAGYERSGLTRREYCERAGLALTTLDYYRQKRIQRQSPRLVAVRVTPAGTKAAQGMALVLGNGRRVEISGEIVEAELAKLVRVAEQA